MKLYIGSDHAGYEMKSQIVNYLKSQSYDVEDVGTYSSESVDYPDYAFKVGEAVARDSQSLGILICGTGFGMCFAVNKVKGIRAVDVVRADMAPLSRQHNNANVLCLSGRYVNFNDNINIINAFLKASYEGGRHQKRIDKISEYEK
ncbi:MAG: ribose 5-phosphate isomerase B [Mycoplasmataceae bacterium]|jgi:ribose 5-phosphate isomerase B|nr:ribose 5-phosphate isomerase B [Mycoplasmataceae bacterium]